MEEVKTVNLCLIIEDSTTARLKMKISCVLRRKSGHLEEFLKTQATSHAVLKWVAVLDGKVVVKMGAHLKK